MKDLMVILNKQKTYFNPADSTFTTFKPSLAKDLALHEQHHDNDQWLLYGDLDAGGPTLNAYLSEDYVEGNPASPSLFQESNKFFLSNIPNDKTAATNPVLNPSLYPAEWTIVSTESFARPIDDSIQTPLVLTGWVRMHTIESTNDAGTVSVLMCHEDANAYYSFNLLRAATDRTPTLAANVEKLDRSGGTTTFTPTEIGFSTNFTNWEFGRKYRFAIILFRSTIRVYIDGVEIINTGDSTLRVGNVGVVANNIHMDFGDFVVTGEYL